MFRHGLEKRDSQAVAAASGTVDASAEEMDKGTLKQIFSSAKVYSLNAPSPLTDPIVMSMIGQTLNWE